MASDDGLGTGTLGRSPGNVSSTQVAESHHHRGVLHLLMLWREFPTEFKR